MNDDLSAIVGGFVGTVAMLLVLFIGEALTGFELRAFEQLAVFVGTPENVLVGFVLFFGAGTFAWALMFVTLGQFLPGGSDAGRGMVFATVLWISFVLLFSGGRENLVLFLAFSLIAHLVYGFTMGSVYDRLADHTIGTV